MIRLRRKAAAPRSLPLRLAALALAMTLAASSCSSAARTARSGRPDGEAIPPNAPLAQPQSPATGFPGARFMVLSDIHVYDPPEFSPSAAQASSLEERPLYGRSLALLREAVSRAIELKPDFVLLPGDLTKDGELPSHESVLRELSRLSAAGIRAFVVPGNHDVENPRARTFVRGKPVALPSPSRADFARLYADCGYADALSRDRDSLGYAARLLPGLRLLALDPFIRPGRPDPLRPEPASGIGRGTMAWIKAQLELARADGDSVIVMSHLSILEHFEGQAESFPASLPRQRGELASLFASEGVELAFTGHFHIQDVVRNTYAGGGSLYDISTGSLAYYPMPYRLVEIGSGEAPAAGGPEAKAARPGARASIRSFRLAEAEPGAPSADAAADAGAALGPREELESWMELVLERKLRRALVPKAEASAIAASFARAYLALAAGDERPAPGDDEIPEVHSLTGKLAGKKLAPLLKSLWRDLPPADNDLEIGL